MKSSKDYKFLACPIFVPNNNETSMDIFVVNWKIVKFGRGCNKIFFDG